MTWNIIQFLINLFQMFVMYKTLDLFYERRFHYKYSVELVIVVTTVVLSIINYNFSISTNILLYMSYYIILIVLNVVIFKGNPFSKIFTFFLMIALIGVTELLSALIIWLITDVDISSLNDEGMGRFLAIIFSQTMVLFIYIITNKKVNKKRMNLKNNSYYLMIGSILFFTVTSILIVIWMYGNIQTNNVSIKEYMVTLTMCVLMLSVISIALTNKIINDMEEKHKLDLELQHVKMERQYFSDVNSALEEIRILRHDMRGELAIIHGYNEMDQKDKIRNHIEKKLLEMDVELIPQLDKDNIITSFLNFKLKEAQLKGITVEIESNLSEENTVFIDKEDLCRILNNILNNAIEANNDCDEKYIQIILKIVNDYIVIKSENPFSGNIINENGIIQTLKKDKTKHGYGLKSIKGIAEKYSGFIDIKYDSNTFKVMVQMLNKI